MASTPARALVVLDLRNSHASLLQVSNEYLAVLEPPQFRRISVLLRGDLPAANSLQPDIPAERVLFLGFNKKMLCWRLRAAWRLRAICREERVDLVIAHRFKSHQVMGLLYLFYPHFTQLAVIHGLHQITSSWRKLFYKRMLSRATFVGVSRAVADDIRHSLNLPANSKSAEPPAQPGPGRVVTLHNVMDVATIASKLPSRDQARRQLGLGEEEIVFGHVGRLSKSKDQSTLLRAFAIVRRDIPGARLVIVGDGSKRNKLTALAEELGIATAVTFTGSLENAWQIMPAFDQFVLTSVHEGFGMVLIEAMIARVPLVVTNAGGIGEVVADCCPLCKPGDVEGVANEMLSIAGLSAEQKKQLGDRLFQRAETAFGRDGMRRRLNELVEQSLA
ncbi:MAG: hypothetical protein DRQ54_01175 [Gammaproteobacteria bacterium]|nr:MAG: hypothetical protein DRQ54_01175 [Gammaproteobacteria bacterium]RLA15459.1 MAG: hypothetical protein DRQ52_01795 [Gammaproteobacteria bacterium]